MKTDQELGEIGFGEARKASLFSMSYNTRTAFARAVREAIFADCGEVPSVEDMINTWRSTFGNASACMEAVRAACTLPLMKRNQELEESLSKAAELSGKSLIIMGKLGMDASTTAEQVIERVDRIRALPEVWRAWRQNLESEIAWEACANELAAALGESKEFTAQDVLATCEAERAICKARIVTDPYKELKAAHKAGKVIQFRVTPDDEWTDLTYALWSEPLECYRIKPFSLREHVAKSFPNLNDTHVFHRDDFTEDMLPEGWRPLLLGEALIQDDQVWWKHDVRWVVVGRDGIGGIGDKCLPLSNHCRTRRPLPLPPVEVPLEAKDVPPGSVIRPELHDEDFWHAVQSTTLTGVLVSVMGADGAFGVRHYTFQQLLTGGQISRDGGKTWEPAKKLKEGK